MKITREQIIEEMRKHFEKNPKVYALWLEGADSTNTVDEYSDIDIWFDVEDEFVEAVFREIEAVLSSLSPLDHHSEAELSHPKLRHRIYHLENTSEFLKLDAVVQCHSRDSEESVFIIGDLIETPKVIFDKKNVIRFANDDTTVSQRVSNARIKQLKQAFSHLGVRRYVARNEIIEAIAYYHHYVVDPLVEVLRIQYTPRHHQYGPVHISRHLPEKVVKELEELYKISSAKQLLENIYVAERMFEETIFMLTERKEKSQKEDDNG